MDGMTSFMSLTGIILNTAMEMVITIVMTGPATDTIGVILMEVIVRAMRRRPPVWSMG